jgi:hypothetical protein
MITNKRHLISRNKREGWYAGKDKMPPDFSLWLAGKNTQVRVERCFSLRAKWDGKRKWE